MSVNEEFILVFHFLLNSEYELGPTEWLSLPTFVFSLPSH